MNREIYTPIGLPNNKKSPIQNATIIIKHISIDNVKTTFENVEEL
jgi:hypothetical protein